MKVAIGADQAGFSLKEHLKAFITQLGFEVIDQTPTDELDFVDAASSVARAIQSGAVDRGIAIDEYGAGSFMVAAKHKGIVCAEISDEHSAKMTRDHNNASMITIGSGLVGNRLAEKLVQTFLEAEYSGGRHQIRVDMLNKMC